MKARDVYRRCALGEAGSPTGRGSAAGSLLRQPWDHAGRRVGAESLALRQVTRAPEGERPWIRDAAGRRGEDSGALEAWGRKAHWRV